MRPMALWPQDLSWSMAHQEGYKDSRRQGEIEQNGERLPPQTQQETSDMNQTPKQQEKN